MNANTRWQESIAENLTASSIPGARKQEVAFSSVEAGIAPGLMGLQGGRFLIPATRVAVSQQQGTLRTTGVPTDLAIDGSGYFEVQLPNGAKAYTRDGEFHYNAQGQLVTKQGYTVLGEGGALQLDPANTAPVSISPNGQVCQGGQVKGQVRMVEFAQPNALKNIGDGYYLLDDPRVQPASAQKSQMRQGYLEGANSSPTTEMASMLTSMRMFEANQKVMQMQDERMGRVITDLGNPPA